VKSNWNNLDGAGEGEGGGIRKTMRRGRRVGWLFSETTGQGFEKNALRVGMGWVGGLIASCSFCTMISYMQLFPPQSRCRFFYL